MNWLYGYLRDETGSSAAEYAIMLGVIGLGVVTAAFALREQIAAGMERTATNINAAQQ
jgi:pilus assembly protein Flp/PilA